MIKFPLTKGYCALIDDEDLCLVNQYRWWTYEDKSGPNLFYALSTSTGKTMSMHRVVMGCQMGDGKQIDHIDGDGLNNQKNNLRFCTGSQNCMNRISANSTSQHKGVTWKKANQKWCAQIMMDGRKKHIGLYEKEKDAAKACDQMAFQVFGEFARLNFNHEKVTEYAQDVTDIFKRKKTSSKYRGVSWHKSLQKWQAQIQINKQQFYLGIYSLEEEAALAYDEVAFKELGEFAKLNLGVPNEC